jgi:hypothetical protein
LRISRLMLIHKVAEYYKTMDWDLETGKPYKKKLMESSIKGVQPIL